jgi:hypothetical protein
MMKNNFMNIKNSQLSCSSSFSQAIDDNKIKPYETLQVHKKLISQEEASQDSLVQHLN